MLYKLPLSTPQETLYVSVMHTNFLCFF